MRKIRTVSRQIQRQRGKVSPRFPSASLFSTPLHSTPKEQTWVLVYFLSGLKWHKLVLISCISCYPKKSRLRKGKYYFSLTTYEVQRKWSNFPKGTIQWMVKTQTQVHPIVCSPNTTSSQHVVPLAQDIVHLSTTFPCGDGSALQRETEAESCPAAFLSSCLHVRAGPGLWTTLVWLRCRKLYSNWRGQQVSFTVPVLSPTRGRPGSARPTDFPGDTHLTGDTAGAQTSIF